MTAPLAAQTLVQSDAGAVYGATPQRIVAASAVLAGLIGASVAGLGLVRSMRRAGDNGRRAAVAALALCPISLITGTVVVTTAKGGVGTGNGVVGGVVAVTIGLIGMVLGGLVLARSRRLS